MRIHLPPFARAAAGALLLGLQLGVPHVARAHPLGNFTISHYAGFDLRPGRVGLGYGLDIAEIPAFQELDRLDANHDGKVSEAEKSAYIRAAAPGWLAGLQLSVDGRPAVVHLEDARMDMLPGAGGLNTLKIWLTLSAPLKGVGPHRIAYKDLNFPNRIGWKEVVVQAQGVRLADCALPSADRSARLTRYPADLINDPPQTLEATFSAQNPAGWSETSPALPAGDPTAAADRPTLPSLGFFRGDAFTRLIHPGKLDARIIALSLLLAFGMGAVHAMSPGHGKTIVGAYLVGSRGTSGQAVFLGAVVTASHTIGVFALGLLTLLASKYILPDRIFPWLGFASGMLVALIGAGLFHERIERLLGRTAEHRHLFWSHRHEPGADPHAGHSHSPTDASGRVSAKSLLALGISGGIVPCPSALVVMLASIALHRIAFGLVLIVAFSLGLAVVLTVIGLLFVHAGKALDRFRGNSTWIKVLPVGSAVVVTILGLMIAVQSLTAAHILRLKLT